MDDDQEAILRLGAKAWNTWREKHKPAVIAISNADFSGAFLTGSDLREAEFDNVNFSRANLSRVRLNWAKLSTCCFHATWFVSADLHGADLQGVDLGYADFSHADLQDANLSGATLTGACLDDANLWRTDLEGANLAGARLTRARLGLASLTQANLTNASLAGADLTKASLRGAIAHGADFTRANLSEARCQKADLTGANLRRAFLVETNLEETNLTGCAVYGIAAWNTKTRGAVQRGLIVTRENEAAITVDELDLAHFVYLLLDNQTIRKVIDTTTSKVVLILGRFTPDRKAVLDALHGLLRTRGYLPILFDFKKPRLHNFTETIATLAHLARFVIADVTDARSVPQELQRIVPHRPNLVVQPIVLRSQIEWPMFAPFRDYPWVLEPFPYDDLEGLLASLETIIQRSEKKMSEIEAQRIAFEHSLRQGEQPAPEL
jgi:uncharacterized protein YjbI with pentapeptide repeats